jgi:intraflagellar transport protein 172
MRKLNTVCINVCRATLKAVDAAVNSRQWLKAVQLLEVLPNRPAVQTYYRKIGQHHANMGEYDVGDTFCV